MISTKDLSAEGMKYHAFKLINSEFASPEAVNEGFVLLEKSADMGDKGAKWELAKIYDSGLYGRERNEEKAKFWYMQALLPFYTRYFSYLVLTEDNFSRPKDFSGVSFTQAERQECVSTEERLNSLYEISHQQGLLALEKLMESEQNLFLQGAVMLIVDGVDSEIVEHLLKTVISVQNPKNADLLKKLIIMQGVLLMQCGNPPVSPLMHD